MMRTDVKVEKFYLYPKPVDVRKAADGLAAMVRLDIKVSVFDPCSLSSSFTLITQREENGHLTRKALADLTLTAY